MAEIVPIVVKPTTNIAREVLTRLVPNNGAHKAMKLQTRLTQRLSIIGEDGVVKRFGSVTKDDCARIFAFLHDEGLLPAPVYTWATEGGLSKETVTPLLTTLQALDAAVLDTRECRCGACSPVLACCRDLAF